MSSSISLTWRRAWNGGGENAAIGDQRLAALLLLHDAVTKFGVLDAMRTCSAEEVLNGKRGYEYLDLSDALATIVKAEQLLVTGTSLKSVEQALDA